MVNQERNEYFRLYQTRLRDWKNISKIFLNILYDDKIEKVYKTVEQKKLVMKKCVKNWVDNNRERYNFLVLKSMNKKNRLNQECKRFRNILL